MGLLVYESDVGCLIFWVSCLYLFGFAFRFDSDLDFGLGFGCCGLLQFVWCYRGWFDLGLVGYFLCLCCYWFNFEFGFV